MRTFGVVSLALLFSAHAMALPLEGFFIRDRFWSTTQAEFEHLETARDFRWTSTAKDSARAAGDGLTIFGLPAVEAVARFEGDKIKELTAIIYARGDAGELSKEKFEQLVKASADAVSAFTKVKFTPRGKDASNAVKAQGLSWRTPQANFLLEYSFTREVKTRDIPFRAEFVRLEITAPVRSVSNLVTATNANQARFTGSTHVKRDATTGDVVVEGVPMVDQGQKGYCAVACTERVMRFYGVQVDANELAQVANSDADRGTSADQMFEAIKKLGARLRVRIRPIEQVSVRDMLALVNDYNRLAKKGNRATEIADPGRMIDVGAIYAQMQPDLLKEVRTKNKADVGKFQRTVQSSVDQGEPLLWSVVLGFVPENPQLPQTRGGHMRLIIGYNTKTQEIMYTDSWGAGHELKRMAIGDAWTITTGLTSIEPL